MRCYAEGDAVYIFGFSRGPYIARFLGEMVHLIFSGYQQICGKANKSDDDKTLEEKMAKFKATFYRPHVNVHFLGLFDCVSSVGQFELPFFPEPSVYVPSSAATHIRHTVSINERRLKFKPALFLLDEGRPKDQDMKEFWFAGYHGDVGGWWDRKEGDNPPSLAL